MSGEAFGVEVVRLHDFFQSWFSGDADASFVDFTHALADEFTIVSPDGSVSSRGEIIDIVQRGRHQGNVDITIVSPTVMVEGAITVGTYEEHQTRDGRSTKRISTAVLSQCPSTPGGWLWHLVHETWLPGGAPDQA